MKKRENKRIDWLDTLRGLAMFFVIWGHSFPTVNGRVKKWLYSFHLPLFFFISGFTFKENDLTFKEFIKKKIKNLVVPYLIFNFLCFIVLFIFYKVNIIDSFNAVDYLIGTFYSHTGLFPIPAPHTWFIMTLFLVEIIFFLLKKISKNDFELGVMVCICGLITYVNSISGYQLSTPWHIETSLGGVVFYFIGYMVAKNMNVLDRIMRNKFKAFMLGGFLGIVGVIIQVFNRRVSMHANIYGSITLFYICALCTIFGLIIFVRLFMKHSFIFKNVGKRSIFFLAYHDIVIVLFRYYINGFNDGNIRTFISAIAVLLILYPFAFLAYKYAPILCGKVK